LRRALSVANIIKGFQVIGIYPINAIAMKFKMGPSEVYVTTIEKTNSAESEENPSPMTVKSQLDD